MKCRLEIEQQSIWEKKHLRRTFCVILKSCKSVYKAWRCPFTEILMDSADCSLHSFDIVMLKVIWSIRCPVELVHCIQSKCWSFESLVFDCLSSFIIFRNPLCPPHLKMNMAAESTVTDHISWWVPSSGNKPNIRNETI